MNSSFVATDYTIVVSDFNSIEKLVRDLLLAQWELHGPPQMVVTAGGGRIMQAMVKYEQKP